ncbi:L,D-transpeptidase family protein [Panacibacter sp. DH6]|uniref:L,D-transpeptidase family protein n=1 Tax=Panacibacter microcysteis TaxID=2793269 RepID=A0A931GXX8_9BACT|nr:L,D-transpeptidase family protein [Panacibacter microcysteis]MBG9376859.1 L,D-transpeptidase family protein [Panacibacter microcysteis]
MKCSIKHLTPALIAAFFLAFLGACNSGNSTEHTNKRDTVPALTEKDITIPGNFSSQKTLKFKSSLVDSFLVKFPLLKVYKKDIDTFYNKRNFAFAWYDNNGLIEQAGNLYNRMQNINEDGLNDSIPYKQAFTELMKNNALDSLSTANEYTELMLTAQYFIYARNVWSGLDEKQMKELDWFLPRKKVSYEQLLDSLISGKKILDTAPVYRQYALLKQQLKKYRDIEKSGGLPSIKADQKTYKTGDSSATVAAIRKLLFMTGDMAADNGNALFDSTLETGVKNFQQRYGEKQDGVIGPAVLKQMQTPAGAIIEQIIVNMERSRWVPVESQTNYIVVNIPDYKLYVYENDTVAWSMNVVVGQPAHKTVVFNGNIKYIVFSPYWNVPSGILKKEVLPGIKRNPSYLAKHNMEWNNGAVRQRPGPSNSLGLVKFLFPNSYDIYLHDTPSKSLFGENDRAFSHGCIRLSQPQKMAEYLLRHDSSWTQQKIVSAMNSGKEQYVTLKETVPVFIAYFTSWVDKDGKLNIRKDVYGRDKRLAEMLLAKK